MSDSSDSTGSTSYTNTDKETGSLLVPSIAEQSNNDDDKDFKNDDIDANIMSYDPRASKKQSSTNRSKGSESDSRRHHKRKSRKTQRSNVESVDVLSEKPKSKGILDIAPSLTSYDSGQLSQKDSDSNKRESLLTAEDRNAYLSRLYSILLPTEEEISSVETLNTDPFPKPEEWKQEEGAKFPGCASFVQLMLYLTQIYTVNIEFQKIFLVTFPSFATPRQLLTAIFKRYYTDIRDPDCNVKDDKILKQMRMRIIRVLQFWVNLVPYQFDDTMVETLNEFYSILQKEYERENQNKKNPVLTILEERMKKLQEHKNNQANKDNSSPRLSTGAPLGKGKSKWVTLMPDPNTLAEQITLLHSEIFRSIGVMELLSAIWGSKKGGGSEHVDELTKHFDLLSRYVQLSIIAERDNPKTRAELFLYWLEVGIRFFKDCNYHGVFAIIYGLTHRSVQRMPQTMKSVEKLLKKKKRKEEYDKLVKLCDISGNYREYRPLIEKDIVGPIIPFIGCFQKDLIYAQEGFPNKINGLINFNKLIKCYELISIVEKYQNEKYKFERNEEYQQAICSFPDLPDTTGIMNLSQEKEKKAK